MKFNIILYWAIAIFTLSGCGSSDNNSVVAKEFNYQFESDKEGWFGDFSDYPLGAEDFYQLSYEYTVLPEPLDDTKGSLLLSGNNHSDDLFMFIKKKISGLTPNATYDVTFDIEFASNVADGIVGIGGSPGEGVTIKAGSTQIEPMKVLDINDMYRMNIDKGNQSNSGKDMIVIGDFSNDTWENVYTLKSVTNDTPFIVQADTNGELWLIVGTDSGFESTTSIYYSRIKVVFK